MPSHGGLKATQTERERWETLEIISRRRRILPASAPFAGWRLDSEKQQNEL